jgi:hypothetical protein
LSLSVDAESINMFEKHFDKVMFEIIKNKINLIFTILGSSFKTKIFTINVILNDLCFSFFVDFLGSFLPFISIHFGFEKKNSQSGFLGRQLI